MAPALVHALTDPATVDSNPEWRGHIFEACVGAHLSRIGCELFYWREGREEVDFVLRAGRDVLAVEVKSGRKKSGGADLAGLNAFRRKWPDAQGVLLDREAAAEFMCGPASWARVRALGQPVG